MLGTLDGGQQLLFNPLRHSLRELGVIVLVGVLLPYALEIAGSPHRAACGFHELWVGRAERAHVRVVQVLPASLLEVNFSQILGEQFPVRLEVLHDCLVLAALLHLAVDQLVHEEEVLASEELHQLLGGLVPQLFSELLQLLASLCHCGLTFTSVMMSYFLERIR